MLINRNNQTGFTLIEIAIVLLIVTILLGYTVALFPKQQELKQYRAVEQEMDEVIDAIIGFAQINGRLPCPSIPASAGDEDYDSVNNDGCDNFGGFVPVNALGINGRTNADSLLLDPWGSPYRYYVTNNDFNGGGLSDFTTPNEMKTVGLNDSEPDGYIDLDGHYLICAATGAIAADDQCTGTDEVFGTYDAGPPVVYGGAPFVLVSHGKNWVEAAVGDELENMGATLTTAFAPPIPNGPAAQPYRLKDVAGGETAFVRRPTGLADDFDDVVKWVSPNLLFSKMIEAEQLP